MEIKLRLRSIEQTRQITSAMKLISSSKLKKAKTQLEQTLPYFNKVKLTILDILVYNSEVIETDYFEQKITNLPTPQKGYIVITGDKGLAGGYNHNIIKLAEKTINDKSNSIVFVVGHVGRAYFTKKQYKVNEDFVFSANNPNVYAAREVSDYILEQYNKKLLDEVYIIYTELKSGIKQEVKMLKLLPLEMEALKKDLYLTYTATPPTNHLLEYEPSINAVFRVLLKKYVKGVLYGALVEAFASEQSARMNAMESATSNANEMIQKLKLHYNRARQAAITQEISEIVGGATTIM